MKIPAHAPSLHHLTPFPLCSLFDMGTHAQSEKQRLVKESKPVNYRAGLPSGLTPTSCGRLLTRTAILLCSVQGCWSVTSVWRSVTDFKESGAASLVAHCLDRLLQHTLSGADITKGEQQRGAWVGCLRLIRIWLTGQGPAHMAKAHMKVYQTWPQYHLGLGNGFILYQIT